MVIERKEARMEGGWRKGEWRERGRGETEREETGSDRNEDVQIGMRPHAKRPCEKRNHQGETEGREYHREVQESATEVIWPRKEARPRLRRKNDSGYDSTREKKARKIEAEMDGLCQPRHDSHRNDERRGP